MQKFALSHSAPCVEGFSQQRPGSSWSYQMTHVPVSIHLVTADFCFIRPH